MLAPRCFSFLLLAEIAAIRNDDDEVGQLLPQHASWWHSAWRRDRPEATFLEEGLAVNATPLCGHVTNMELEGHVLHCDQQFAQIRAAFQVEDPEDILKKNNIDLQAAEKGEGKSGAKMIFSDNKKYMVKTMTSRDLGIIKQVINEYVSHVVSHASTSEMMRLYAIIEDPEGGFWLIGNNWLPVKFPITWDLKGSMVGRQSGAETRAQKDKDWLAQSKALAVAPTQRAALLQALESEDSSMLARSNLIDYSLVVGVLVYDLEPCDGPNEPACVAPICHPQGGCGEAAYNLGDYFGEIKDYYCSGSSLKDRELGHSCVGSFTTDRKVYFQCFGIIDLWKPFDLKSKIEYSSKAGFARQVSVQPADVYAKRFFEFMHEKVFSKDLAAVSAPLTFTPQSCGAWGSRQHASKGSDNTVIIVVAVCVALILGTLLAWYFWKKPKAGEVGGEALQAYEPEASHSYQGQSYQGQGYQGQTYDGYQGQYQSYPEGYPAGSWPQQGGQSEPQAAWPASG